MNDKIITTSLELFKEKGVKFTMDDVSKSMKVSKKRLYLFVENKEDLLNMVVNSIFDSIKVQEKEILNKTDLNDLEKLKMILKIQPYVFNDIAYSKIFQMKVLYPDVYAYVEKRLEEDWEPIIQLFNSCIASGLIIDIDINLVKCMINGSIEKIIESDFLQVTNFTFDKALNDCIDIFFLGLEK